METPGYSQAIGLTHTLFAHGLGFNSQNMLQQGGAGCRGISSVSYTTVASPFLLVQQMEADEKEL